MFSAERSYVVKKLQKEGAERDPPVCEGAA